MYAEYFPKIFVTRKLDTLRIPDSLEIVNNDFDVSTWLLGTWAEYQPISTKRRHNRKARQSLIDTHSNRIGHYLLDVTALANLFTYIY